jgi:hypothetical protein
MVPSRAIKMTLANEGSEARKKEEEVASKKRKAEDDKAWEGAILFFFPFCISRRSCLVDLVLRIFIFYI